MRYRYTASEPRGGFSMTWVFMIVALAVLVILIARDR